MTFDIFAGHALWQEVQEARVRRWGKAEGYEQHLLQHMLSFCLTADRVASCMKRVDTTFDVALFQRAALVHDIGEVLLKRDVWGPGKTAFDDAAEYKEFTVFIAASDFPRDYKKELRYAFLLQFVAAEEYNSFLPAATYKLRELRETYWLEACAFSLAEILDYFQSALAGIQQKAINATRHYGRRPILQATWLDQEARADALVLKAPQLSVLWNDEVKQQIQAAIDLEREAHRPR